MGEGEKHQPWCQHFSLGTPGWYTVHRDEDHEKNSVGGNIMRSFLERFLWQSFQMVSIGQSYLVKETDDVQEISHEKPKECQTNDYFNPHGDRAILMIWVWRKQFQTRNLLWFLKLLIISQPIKLAGVYKIFSRQSHSIPFWFSGPNWLILAFKNYDKLTNGLTPFSKS